jgi:hypothetical protein
VKFYNDYSRYIALNLELVLNLLAIQLSYFDTAVKLCCQAITFLKSYVSAFQVVVDRGTPWCFSRNKLFVVSTSNKLHFTSPRISFDHLNELLLFWVLAQLLAKTILALWPLHDRTTHFARITCCFLFSNVLNNYPTK